MAQADNPLGDYPFYSAAEKLADAIERSCEESVGGEQHIAVAFSGGLDSALLAMLLSRICDTRLYVAGKKGCQDIAAAELAAEALVLPLTVLNIDNDGLAKAAARAEAAMVGPAPIEIAVAIPMAFVCQSASERLVVTGTGADELFGGYSRYLRMPPNARLEAMNADYVGLAGRGALHETRIAESYSKELAQPYMHPGVAGVAGAVGPEAHHFDGVRKALLRAAALRCGLPIQIATREKKAAQYGSGVARMMSKAARCAGSPSAPVRKGY